MTDQQMALGRKFSKSKVMALLTIVLLLACAWLYWESGWTVKVSETTEPTAADDGQKHPAACGTSWTIYPGESVELKWTAEGAKRLTLDPGGIDVTGDTSYRVSPSKTTLYALTAVGKHESVACYITVIVSTGPRVQTKSQSL